MALLLVVGLAAFSNSMRELAEIQQFTLDTSRLIAQYIAPAETPQIPQVVVAKLNSCERRQAVPSVGLDVEALTEPVQPTVPAPPVKVQRVVARVASKPTEPTEFQLANLDKLTQIGFQAAPFKFNPQQFEFKVSTNRKQNVFKLNTRDRERILRTLNRSINLRTAS